MKQRLVLLDFDGTITRNDTLFEFIHFYHGYLKFIFGILFLSPAFLGMKLKIISNHQAKQLVLRYFFAKIPIAKFNAACQSFAFTIIPDLVRPNADKLLKKEKASNSVITVISASPENWIRPWCEANHIQCIATQLEVVDNHLSGNIRGQNCNGAEKVSRIKEAFNLETFDQIVAYGDSSGDQEMFTLAHEVHYREL